MAPEADPLDDVLNLEEQFYQEGYDQGLKDGTEAGKIEGRAFGMQKGFEKFFESGRLHSKATVWAHRCAFETSSVAQDVEKGDTAPIETISPQPTETSERSKGDVSHAPVSPNPGRLPPFPVTRPTQGSPGMQKWAVDQRKKRKAVNLILELLEPSTLSFKNETADVDDFDSRLKGAQARLKIIELGMDRRETGESEDATTVETEQTAAQGQWPAPKAVKNEW